MKQLINAAILSIAALSFDHEASAHLVINEIMQSNIDCIMDDLNEFPDSWVELYNPGPDTENLADYKISTKHKVKNAYQLPARSIQPGEYLIVYCDKVGQDIHADFRLESGKDGALYLFKGDETVDYLEGLKKQPAPNIAYGRKTDNAEKWDYQSNPTPGSANCGSICKDISGEPIFSHQGRVSSEKFDLTLSLPEDAPESSVIRYTLDGKEPTESSPAYSSPIKISGTTTVRAKIFCEGYLTPRSTTHSFIMHPRDVSLPVVSMVTNRDYFFDNKLGIYVKGDYSESTPNFNYDWRRPVNIEYFEGADTESSFNQLCETRVKGGATRKYTRKSLVVYANKRFGQKRFNHEFFPNQTPGIDNFKSFEMRNSGNDFDYMYMRDAVIQQCMGMNCDLDWQPSRPAIFYLNGEYMGILNIRPRSNEDHIYSYYDELEDIDMVENWIELKEGSFDSFYAFRDFYFEPGHSFEEYNALMDTEEFCNLMIMCSFFDNKDFPGNNIMMWRPQADGGRWRWVAKDNDFGLGLYDEPYYYPTLDWITTPGFDNNHNDWANQPNHSVLFRHLLDTQEFSDMFIERCAVYMGDFLRPEVIIRRIEDRYNEIKDEYQFHRELFNPKSSAYSKEVDKGKTWIKNRWPFFYNHLSDFFNLSEPVNLSIKDNPGRRIIINGVALTGNEFDGKYFPGRMLTVESYSDTDSLYVNGWEVTVTETGRSSRYTYAVETLTVEMPEGKHVAIRPLLSTTPILGGTNPVDAVTNEPYDVYDTAGRYLGRSTSLNPLTLTLNNGIYIVRQGEVTKKIIVK